MHLDRGGGSGPDEADSLQPARSQECRHLESGIASHDSPIQSLFAEVKSEHFPRVGASFRSAARSSFPNWDACAIGEA